MLNKVIILFKEVKQNGVTWLDIKVNLFRQVTPLLNWGHNVKELLMKSISFRVILMFEKNFFFNLG